MKNKNKPLKDSQSLVRDHRLSFTLNEKEYNAICRYIDKHKIKDANRWMRETLLIHVLQKMEEHQPMLFAEDEMRRL